MNINKSEKIKIGFGRGTDEPLDKEQEKFLLDAGYSHEVIDELNRLRYLSHEAAISKDLEEFRRLADIGMRLLQDTATVPVDSSDDASFDEVFDDLSEYVSTKPEIFSISGINLGSVCCSDPAHNSGIVLYVPSKQFRARARIMSEIPRLNFVTLNTYDVLEKETSSVRMTTDKARELAAELIRCADLADSL
jgi:hypothetical protein